MESEALYQDREQTLVKHFVLRHYLQRFAHIVGRRWDSITYVDCFAGPWNVRSQDLTDTSFHIALDELRKARQTHQGIGIRCFFLEQDPQSFSQLRDFAQGVHDAEVVAKNKKFEDAVVDIASFIRKGGPNTIPFLFIDPTGWTGFALETITPLLRVAREVLINFMTGHIRRFLEQEQSQQSFEKLFGSSRFRGRIEGLSGIEREDAAVTEYLECVRLKGDFEYACTATVLHPEIDRTHFHLLYLTRHPKGVEVFKETEKRAMQKMEEVRAEAQKRKREEKSRQFEIFSAQETHDSSHYEELRNRYLQRAKQRVLDLLGKEQQVAYDQAWITALSLPLAWESDLKDWIHEWQKAGKLQIAGLQGRERVPKQDNGHRLLWSG